MPYVKKMNKIYKKIFAPRSYMYNIYPLCHKKTYTHCQYINIIRLTTMQTKMPRKYFKKNYKITAWSALNKLTFTA